MSETPETQKAVLESDGQWSFVLKDCCERLERERDEARGAFKEMWRSGDAFLPHVDSETINRWRKAAGWDETK